MPHPDQRYIDALLSNNTSLHEELYKKFSAKIKWMVLQNSGTEADAGDIFQDALMSIYSRAKGGNFILTCPFDAFIYAVCRNKWLKELNKRQRKRVTFKDIEEYNDPGEDSFRLADQFCLQQARKDLLTQKLGELGENCKQLLYLSWSGKSMDQVAGELNVSYGYARKRKSECMSKLIMLVKGSPEYKLLKW